MKKFTKNGPNLLIMKNISNILNVYNNYLSGLSLIFIPQYSCGEELKSIFL
jgi:hypothetical protein